MFGKLDLEDFFEFLPAVFAILVIPFSQMIATGTALSFLVFFCVQLARGDHKKIGMWIVTILSLLHILLLTSVEHENFFPQNSNC